MDRLQGETNQRMSQSSASNDSRDRDTAIAISADEIGEFNSNSDESTLRDADEDKKSGEAKCSSCVIDINSKALVVENQRLCRICHLNAKEIGKSSQELVELGCGCKGELGVAHPLCAEAWFRVRGNRLCEICGETAKNVTGGGTNNGFMEEWNESRSANTSTISSEGNRRCLRGQPLCNLLMACLVIAFILPWFFRVNMF